ncbi:hypothetical protein H4219_003722 [Mycoemilia scoparia]|uniref:Glutathione S-transferase n=1 Tax=Mycoemilia scoparia TaxID=417184 RepID=A0A9W8A3E1_9FUNG|nr:hypothetical protein H4219_003722 [Mycoemilia scoparia]
MSSFELIYFPLPGRGESIRNILKYANANWEETNPDWPSAKSQTPFGKLPVLVETNSRGEKFTLTETRVIERYLATIFNLYPRNATPQTIATIDQYRDQYSDVFDLFVFVNYAKETNKQQAFDDAARNLVQKHEEILRKNGSNGHYFGGSITYVDISAYSLIHALKQAGFGKEFSEDKAPELNKLLKTVQSKL